MQTTIDFGNKYRVWEKSYELKELEKRSGAVSADKFPNVPRHAITQKKYEDKTANGLQRAIIDFLAFEGWQAERINVMGRPVFKTIHRDGKDEKVLDKWITGQGTKGSADVSATINGRSVKIEVKIGRDRQREEQMEYQQAVERAGGLYVIVKTFSEFVSWYNTNCIANNNKQQ